MSEQGTSVIEILNKLKVWFYFILSKWKSILLATVIGILFGVGFANFKAPIYTANLTFALEEKDGNGIGIGSLASQFGISLGVGEGGAFAGDNLIELLKSRFIIEKTLLTKVKIENNTDFLVNHYIGFNKLDEMWEKDNILKDLNFIDSERSKFTLQQDSVLGTIYKDIVDNMLSVNKVDKKLSIVKVSISSKDELFAKYFAENIVKNVTDFYIETKTSKSRANISLLEYRADSVRRELDAAMYGRAFLSDQNMGLVRQSAAVPKIKQEMRVQMLSTMYGELIKNLEFSKLALMREEPLIQLIDTPILPLENDKKHTLIYSIIFAFVFSALFVLYFIFKKVIFEISN